MPKVTEMYAFVAADKDGDDEGIMGFQGADGGWVPLVGADMNRVDSLREIARSISESTGIKYKILHFKLDGELEK